MSKFEGLVILLVAVICSIGLLVVSKQGSMDRSFYVYDYSTGKNISVTERTINDHFSIAPSEEGCDLMGICKVNGKTMLSPKKYGG